MEMRSLLVAFFVAYLWGALPLGFLAVKSTRKVDIRRLSPYNVGFRPLLALAGPAAVGAFFLDVAKGALPPLLSWMIRPEPGYAVAAALGVLIGHLYSPYFLFTEGSFPRAKSVGTAAGAAGGLWLVGFLPLLPLLFALGVWMATIALPRLWGRWGYPSLASVLAALTLAIGLGVSRTPHAGIFFGIALCVLVLWRHKENLGRIADGLEPRLGEYLPVPGLGEEVGCAFLIHPMSPLDWWQSNRFRWLRPLADRGIIPFSLLRWLSRYIRPMKVDEIRSITTTEGKRARVYLLGVPLLPDQIKGEPALALRRTIQAARLARDLGAVVMGLGAYWSVVGQKGIEVQEQSEIVITNGGAFTAGTVRAAVPQILGRLQEKGISPRQATAAVVGANGVVGFGICRMIAGEVGRLIMVGTDLGRLERSRQRLASRFPRTTIEITTDLRRIREADVIFTATNTPEAVVYPEHVREGALIYDLGRPADVHPSVAQVPRVEVIPGGVVRPPGNPTGRIDLGYGPGLFPACLAETVIIALDGAYERRSLGERTRTENIEYFVRRAEEMGFRVVTEAPDTRSQVSLAASPTHS
ncbi:MAG: glycerol-3-phosphate acyltransferase [Armatimonadota bacterium]|nr:glycerol-3-phosphate acyltransferase [Armatimonadota bacterium]